MKIQKEEKFMFPIKWVTTNNSEREIWRYLQLFSKESYVSKLVKEKRATDQITSCIRQAREIYSSSRSTSLLTKPVLLYYGMQRLAKALIFLRNPNVDLNDLKHHGLSGRGISDKIEKFLDNRIPKNKKGIFPEFSKWTTKNNILLKKTVYGEGDYQHTDFFVHECKIPDFLKASEFKVYDLFSLIPELRDLFVHFKMKNDLLVLCYMDVRQHPDGKTDNLLTVEKKIEFASLKTGFPTIGKYNILKEYPDRFILESTLMDKIEIPSPLVQSETKIPFLITSTNSSNRISDMNVHLILMFFLCHIARYKAPLLKDILEGQGRSEFSALIEKFIEVSETKFPKLILDELEEQYFMFFSKID